LASQHFKNIEELMKGVKTWLNMQAADLFVIGTQELIYRYDVFLSSSSDYVGK
jgi:hypothetical protein